MLLAASLPSAPVANSESPFEQALTDQSAWVIRGQSPAQYASSAPLVAPPNGTTTYYQGGMPAPGYGAPANPYGASPYGSPAYPQPVMQDPWATGGAMPYAQPAPGMMTYGMNGPQPRRTGWQGRYDFTYIPEQGTSNPNVGGFEVFGIDIEHVFTEPLAYGWTKTIAPQFNYRSWQGPGAATPSTDLPGGAYRFGLDMRLQTPTVGGWSIEGGFTPAVASDFRSTLTSDAWQFDGHLVAFWQWSPQLMWAIGAMYWDRVDNIILPYAGLVYTPNDIWEFRLIFPKPRISVFLGTPWGIPTWMYVGGEYHVESYQVKPKLMADETEVQFKDWRVTGGFRWESGWMTSFAEAGYIFARDVEFRAPGTGFEPDSGFIGRVGFRY